VSDKEKTIASNMYDLAYDVSLLERNNKAIDSMVEGMARLIVGRLHKVESEHVLCALKHEIKNYNCNTSQWKQ
jgi:hypothetical protein